MSSGDINLVSSKTFQLEKELKRFKTLKLAAIGSLSLVALVSVLLFILTITTPVSSVKKDQEQTLSNISSLNEKLVKYSLINDRLSNISDILKTRKDYANISALMLDKLPVDLAVESLVIEDKTLSLTVSGTSLTLIDSFIKEIVVLGDKETVIKNLVIQSLTTNADSGKYSLALIADVF